MSRLEVRVRLTGVATARPGPARNMACRCAKQFSVTVNLARSYILPRAGGHGRSRLLVCAWWLRLVRRGADSDDACDCCQQAEPQPVLTVRPRETGNILLLSSRHGAICNSGRSNSSIEQYWQQ